MASHSHPTDFLSYVLSCVHYSVVIITIHCYFSLRPAAGNTVVTLDSIDA